MKLRSGSKLTKHLKEAFLADYRVGGNVTRAVRRSGVPYRCLVYVWQEHDAQFAQDFQQARIEATEVLEEEARRRAEQGVTTVTPVYHNGTLIDTVEETKYSDTLMIFLLKSLAPEKYRDRVQLQHADADGQKLPLAAVEEFVRNALGSR